MVIAVSNQRYLLNRSTLRLGRIGEVDTPLLSSALSDARVWTLKFSNGRPRASRTVTGSVLIVPQRENCSESKEKSPGSPGFLRYQFVCLFYRFVFERVRDDVLEDSRLATLEEEDDRADSFIHAGHSDKLLRAMLTCSANVSNSFR